MLTTTAVLLCSILSGAASAKEKQEEKPVVEDGKQVSIEYTLKLDDGSTADTNVGDEPLVFTVGASQILPALESALLGMSVTDSKHVTLTPAQGYGEVNPDAFTKVSTEMIPEDARTVGTMLMAQDAAGNQRPVRVHEVTEDEVTIDQNHPLAGETLEFDVKILKID